MSSYIGKVQVGSGDQILVGSTLYGICNTAASTAAKTVTLSSFDTLMNGITIHVRFVNGNSATTGITLAVGTTSAQSVVGNCICNANDVVAFTYQEETVDSTLVKTWYVNSNIVVAEGSTNGTVKVNGQAATVHGLGSAAYVNTGNSDEAADGAVATVGYVKEKTGGLSGLTGAMHFKGSVNSLPDATSSTTFTNYDSGDVVLGPNDKEYVYVRGASAAESEWVELGDEGSYVLQTSQTSGSVGSASGWSAGSASSATVSGGILQLTNSTTPSLTVTSTNVIVPVTTP